MAPVYRDGKWRVRTRLGGKQVSHTFTRKVDAEKKERDLQREKELMRAGLEMPTESVLFTDYARTFLRRRERTHPRSTCEADETRLRKYCLDPLGMRPLQTISSREIRELLDNAQAEHELSNATRNRIRAVLHTLWENAIKDGKAIVNPVARAEMLSEKKKTRKPDAWYTADEVNRYIHAAYEESEVYGVVAELLLFAGLRIGELIGLQIQDVDFDRELITVRRTLERASLTIVDRTKAGASIERIVPLFPRVRIALTNHIRTCKFNKRADFIAHRPDGRHMSYDSFRQVHERIIARACVKPIRIHDMRATFASQAEESGFSRGDIQAMLGHASSQTTEGYIRKNVDQLVQRGKAMSFGRTG